MRQQRNRAGFSIAEMLVVMAILAVLGGLTAVGVVHHQHNMALLERDGIAKELFISAQNHLAMAESQGYLGLSSQAYGIQDAKVTAKDPDTYYFMVNQGDQYDKNTVLDLMLPFASVDETVRKGGSYVIRYQANPARVLEVFYCSPKGTRFGHEFQPVEYSSIRNLSGAGSEQRENRKNYKFGDQDTAVVGWYGGTDAASMTMSEDALLLPPSINSAAGEADSENSETLRITVTDPNDNNSDASLRLIVRGKTSGAEKYFDLNQTSKDNIIYHSLDGTYTVLLDDITTPGLHFYDLFHAEGFVPGENLSIQAVAYSNSKLTNVVYSPEKIVNSLFADIETHGDVTTAKIRCIRHLENLDNNISHVAYYYNNLNNGNTLNIQKAEQISNVTWDHWTDYLFNKPDSTLLNGNDVSIFSGDNATKTETGCFLPVSPNYPVVYDGGGYSISGIPVNEIGNAGLFGTLQSGSDISNLKLIDLSITSSSGKAGALIGAAEDTAVTNVVAYHTSSSPNLTVTASGDAGGLIGSMKNGTVERCAAALCVKSNGGNAGGLIGSVTNGTIESSYSGGHTRNGAYEQNRYNITASSAAGGLVGTAGSATIRNSYSTCSASGQTAGGLAGKASGSITSCYATGLVQGSTKGAFVGNSSATLSGNRYYEIINQKDTPSSNGGIDYLNPLGNDTTSSGVTPLDASADSYRVFFSSSISAADAIPYDRYLSAFRKYGLRSVAQLMGTSADGFVAQHYGDWPVPELLVVNTK